MELKLVMLFPSVLLFRKRNIPSVQSGDSTGTPVLVLLLFMSQRFCSCKALQHGGRRKALLFRCQAGAQCRTCPLTGAAHLFLPSPKAIAFNVWILHVFQHQCVHVLALCLSSFISLREQQDKSFDNLFPG